MLGLTDHLHPVDPKQIPIEIGETDQEVTAEIGIMDIRTAGMIGVHDTDRDPEIAMILVHGDQVFIVGEVGQGAVIAIIVPVLEIDGSLVATHVGIHVLQHDLTDEADLLGEAGHRLFVDDLDLESVGYVSQRLEEITLMNGAS